ncbi:MAG: 1-deoxy-D-xylulose-5-phosphate reductoisomerase, partial [Cyanobacteria bacterium]|nr:1-deoxy-D-xylulose-5-phosphate reductoisomerase [Cyanobacteriota bacterium]
MKRISLIGSTGSIGKQSLDIARASAGEIEILGLAAGSRTLPELASQILEFRPRCVSVPSDNDINELKDCLRTLASEDEDGRDYDWSRHTEFVSGAEGLISVATLDGIDVLVTAVVGFLGLRPTIEAIKRGTTIALANKETLVAGGSLVMPMAKKYNAKIVPVDSEHSAIFQSLAGESKDKVDYIWLTGSGGPFRTWTLEQIRNATIDDALKHPNWAMGPKITIDSATMMNKGLEVIEARWLFDMHTSRIKVVIHPQSILHSAVEFIDGSIVGQMGVPDMRLPIHYALFHPDRVRSDRVPRLNLLEVSQLTFEAPDEEKFPCLRLAREIAGRDDTTACVLNAANEIVVESFLKGRVKFHTIADHINRVLERHNATEQPSLEDI